MNAALSWFNATRWMALGRTMKLVKTRPVELSPTLVIALMILCFVALGLLIAIGFM
jgi:hypothetical protein